MRDFGFPIEFADQSQGATEILLRTASGFTAAELLADDIIGSQIAAGLKLLSAAAALRASFTIEAAGAEVIRIFIPEGVVTAAWHLATILNLIDGSTFVGRLTEAPFLAAALVRSPVQPPVPGGLAALETALQEQIATARAAMTERLPESFALPPGLGRQWPEAADRYFIAVFMPLAGRLAPAAVAQAREVFIDMDRAVAGSAFEPVVPPEAWFENAQVPYPVEISADAAGMEYRIEQPPCDIAIGLFRVEAAILALTGTRFGPWQFDLAEGW